MNECQMCFKLVYLIFFFGKETLGQTCYTPDKQQGHCVPLNECPKAFSTFANPPKGSETYLHRFLCKDDQQLKVCCGTTANFTLLENYLISDYAETSKQIVERDAFMDIKDGCDSGPLSATDLPLILVESVDSEVKPKKCLGILANSRYVITPAQCIEQKIRLVGVQFRGKNKNSITFGVEEILPHPFFDPVTGVNDVALLRLNQTVSSDDVAVLCQGSLPFIGRQLIYTNVDLFTIERGLHKRTVYIPTLSKEDCEQEFLQKGAYAVVTEYDLCTNDLQNVTKFTCNEFTGVPFFTTTEGFLGFSSTRTVCKDGLPDIYTNVNAYKDWLIDQMRPWPTNNDPCTTPNGEIGECWNLYHCPALLDASSDVTNEAEAPSLRGYICKEEQDTEFAIRKLSVCCVTSSNSTVMHTKDEAEPIEVPTKFLETRLCGLQHRDDYFTSSTAVAIDEFPWIATIKYFSVICTGTLINSRYVLTTGACLDVEFDRNNTFVRLGDYDWYNDTSCVKDPDVDATDCTETEKYGIEDIIRHPFYLPYIRLNDISLLRLNKTVPYYTDFVRPICLPVPGTLTAKVGDTMYMSSWGIQSGPNSADGEKTKVLTQLIEKKECQRLLRKAISVDTFCTLDYEDNTDFFSYADEGGALMFHDNYRWHIEGILLLDEHRNAPVLYVNVSRYINWILKNMKSW